MGKRERKGRRGRGVGCLCFIKLKRARSKYMFPCSSEGQNKQFSKAHVLREGKMSAFTPRA